MKRARPDGPRAGRRAAATAALLGLALHGCGGTSSPPAAGDARGFVPDLSGARVMVFPVQRLGDVPGDADAELAFALPGRQGTAEWVLPAELRRAVASAPGMDVSLDRLPVDMFLRAEVQRVGDPLYGNLRRLAALTDAQAALIPVQADYRAAAPPDTMPGTDRSEVADTAGRIPAPGRVEVTAVLLEVRSGRVLWHGVVGGAPGPADDPAVLATAMDALARRLAGR